MYWTTDTGQHRHYIHHRLGPILHMGEPGNEAKPDQHAKLGHLLTRCHSKPETQPEHTHMKRMITVLFYEIGSILILPCLLHYYVIELATSIPHITHWECLQIPIS